MLEQLKAFFSNKSILVLGFGIEGKSTYRVIRRILPDAKLAIADANDEIVTSEITKHNNNCRFMLGKNYLDNLSDFDIVIKSPGISLKQLHAIDSSKFTSHTELFIRFFKKQIIGITGTKGKSTTSSLIYHIIKQHTSNCILVGNIGIPPFELIDTIDNETVIVYELSSHQLEKTRFSPHIAILLNLYQEHLDHYETFEKYQEAKFNITLNQHKDDYFIYNADDTLISIWLKENNIQRNFMPYSLKSHLPDGCFIENSKIHYPNASREIGSEISTISNLQGEHNLLNIMAAICAVKIKGVPDNVVNDALKSFKPLENRMEYVGVYDNVIYYNDSISTIPEATIAALNTLKVVDTLILGGFDRGIYYDDLIDFIENTDIRNVIFIGKAGKRMQNIYCTKQYVRKKVVYTNNFEEAVLYAKQLTSKNKICLLSPAAASYDMFKNFVERGDVFKQMVRK
ncbi:MAG: UDP-N-acetylmuramoyl-L-alanine--D-glutamate ligase [Bacteroidota bacterium]